MKKISIFPVYMFALMSFGISQVSAQDTIDRQIALVDLKMNLVETKLDLLDSKISLWEKKPEELEMKLREIEIGIARLTFDPGEFNEKFTMLESLIEKQQSLLEQQNKLMAAVPESFPDTVKGSGQNRIREPFQVPPAKYVISVYPLKLMEGTLQLSLERILNKGNSIELSGMATYATKDGIANYYLKNQDLMYYSALAEDYISYDSENISGYGGSLLWRNYLFPRTHPGYAAPAGLYAAPQVMYRRVFISGFDQVYNDETEEWEDVEITRRLHIFTGGFQMGWHFVLWKTVTADVYAGGSIRLSKYDGEENFTKYKKMYNVDFSGVMPTLGIKIGIVK